MNDGSRCGPALSTCSSTTTRSFASATATCCCAATTAPASPRCSRSCCRSCWTASWPPIGSSPTPTRASGWSGTSCSAVATRSGSATPGWSSAASPRMAAPRTSPSAAASRPSPAAGSPPAGSSSPRGGSVWTCAWSARWAPRSSVTGSSRRWAIPAGSSTTPRRTGERSRALSQALGPVDQAVLADVAESFHDLEQQRDELRGLQETRGHVERFLGRYRHYARIAARRQAAELRAAQSAYEATNRQLVAVRHDLVGAREAEAATAAALELSERDLGAARAAVQELAAAPEIQRLDRAEELARLARAAADRTRRLHDDAERLRDRRETDRDRAAAAASASRAAVTAAVEASGLAADAAGTRRDHDALLAPLALPDGGGEPSAGVEEAALGRVRNAVAATADRREQAIGHVRALAERATGAAGRLAAEHRRLNDLAAERDQAAEHRRDAEEAVAEEARALVDAWRRYAAALTEVRLEQEHPPAGLDGILADLEDWTGTLAGASPARAALAAAAGTTRNRLAEARATALSQLGAAATALEALVEQRERLERGEHEQPPAPYTRPAGVRDGRAGAPLWQVVDFREGVGDGERAGLEAALEAAGLLDAWVTPDGRLLAPGTHDVVVTAGTPARQNLGAVLAPAIDRDDPQAAALSEIAVGAVLAGIGLGPRPGGEGDAGTWVEPTGRWRLGVAEGAWRSEE